LPFHLGTQWFGSSSEENRNFLLCVFEGVLKISNNKRSKMRTIPAVLLLLILVAAAAASFQGLTVAAGKIDHRKPCSDRSKIVAGRDPDHVCMSMCFLPFVKITTTS